MISIKRWTGGAVIHSGDFASVKECLEDGVRKGICFDYAELNDVELNDVELNYAKLNYVKLNRVRLNNAELNDAELNNAELNDAELNRAEFRGVQLNGAQLNNVEFNGARLNYAEFNNVEFNNVEFNGAWLNAAQLNYAQLNDVELNGARLWRTTGNNKQIKNINNLRWPITYTKDTMQIGCERHLISEWEGFTDKRIDSMDEEALEFWKEHKQMIFNTIEESPAEE